ncbi:MAG: TIM44-like domain-containing protein [bacterium]|nr:TIM44-like domain-containing protein [bacterium]
MKFRSKSKGFMLFLLAMVVVTVFAAYLDARVGGGHGYSGRSRGGGSGGGGGDVIFLIFRLVFRYPIVGVPILIIVIGLYVMHKKNNPQPDGFMSSLDNTPSLSPMNSLARDKSVTQLQSQDPKFSLPLFLDFAQALYTNIIQFAANQQLHKMKAYMDKNTLEKLASQNQNTKSIRDVIIGNCTITQINLSNPAEDFITLTLETNYTIEITTGKQAQTFYEYANWTLARKKGVISKAPGDIEKLGCTQCGAPVGDNPDDKCAYCGHISTSGTLNWYVKTITILDKTRKSPNISGGYAAEQGTNFATVFQPGLPEKLAAFKGKYPHFDENKFFQKAAGTFKILQEAWSSHKWELARPVESDYLFQTHLYWINLYKKEKVRNVLKDVKVSKIQLTKIQNDAFFDAITVRIFASLIDYTESLTGQHIGGNRKKPRAFSEYWTFIRRAGIEEKETNPNQCPKCGDELKIGMVGKCGSCGSKITTGEFSWILSQIEQDESYMG